MDSEEMAWAWLQRMVEGLCDETPEDLAYSADQMVDATPPETADERQAAIVAALRGDGRECAAHWIESGEWRRT